MIREDTNKNIIERFPSMESDLKLHAIPQLNKNKEDIWTAIKILAFYAVLGVYAYYKYMEMTGEPHTSPSVTRYTLMLLGAVPVGIVIALDEQTVCAGRESDKKNYEGREKDS